MSQPQTIGRYRIVRLLGSGAMGDVYLAEDPNIHRELAIKTVRVVGGTPDDVADRKQRLLREARAAGKFVHPNVVTLFDADESNGTLYLAFEYVPPGIDLAQRMTGKPAVTLREALRWVREIAQALQFAHDRGIVHRDIKPSNVLVAQDGTAKVADFGIAKLLGPGTELTRTGSVVGSPQYMSPEQVRGETLDGRSDVFSLGVVSYELLCGIRPFGGETLSTLVFEILSKEPLAVGSLRPSLPGGLVSLAHRMLAKDRNHRCASATEVVETIRGLEASIPAHALDDSAAPSDTDETQRMVTALSAQMEAQTVQSSSQPPYPSTPPPPPVPQTGQPPRPLADPTARQVPAMSTALPPRAAVAAGGSSTLRNVVLGLGVLGILGVALLLGLWIAVKTFAPQMLPASLGGAPDAETTLVDAGDADPAAVPATAAAETTPDAGTSGKPSEGEPPDRSESARGQEASSREALDDLRAEVARAKAESASTAQSPPPPQASAAPATSAPAASQQATRPPAPQPAAPQPASPQPTDAAPPRSPPVETRPTSTPSRPAPPPPKVEPQAEPEPEPVPPPKPAVDEELQRWQAAAGRADQEMNSGLHFRFDIKPKDLIVVVRVWPKGEGSIVKGQAEDFKDGRKGRDMTLPGSGDHLLQLLINGEVQRSILVHASAANSQTTTVSLDLR